MATPNASESEMAHLSFQGDRFDRRVGLPQLKTGIDQERIASIDSSPEKYQQKIQWAEQAMKEVQ
jgi:hypothetical protein